MQLSGELLEAPPPANVSMAPPGFKILTRKHRTTPVNFLR